MVLGALLYRSGYIPGILGVLLVAAGVGYVVDSMASLPVDGYGGYLAVVLLAPAGTSLLSCWRRWSSARSV